LGIEKPRFMTLLCFLLISLFFWGCGIFLFLFTLLAPYNIYSFREVNIYINNKNKNRRFDIKYLLKRECFSGLEAPWRFRSKSLLKRGSLHLVLNGCVYLLCIHIWLNSLIKYMILDGSSFKIYSSLNKLIFHFSWSWCAFTLLAVPDFLFRVYFYLQYDFFSFWLAHYPRRRTCHGYGWLENSIAAWLTEKNSRQNVSICFLICASAAK